MKIDLLNAGKRFNREWIFRHFDYHFISGRSYAITGPNGSGKSTLLQLIATASVISEGSVIYNKDNQIIDEDKIFKYITIVAPYLDLVEEMTLIESMKFHQKLKPFLVGFNPQNIIEKIGLEKSQNKQLRYFSSGMKQRVKLAQALFSDTPIILLDEPCTNLDTSGIELYNQLILDHCSARLLIVSSNDLQEYEFCDENLNMQNIRM